MNASTTNGVSTDAGLLARLPNWSDQQSWTDFYRAYRRLIYEFARRQGLNDQEAQDVVQDTLLSVARSLHSFKYEPSRASFKGWLHQIVRHRVIDHVRRRPQEQPLPRRASGAESGSGTGTVERVPDPASLRAGERWEREWKEHVLQAALDKLKRQVKPRHYQVFHLAVIKQQSTVRVAETLDISTAQVYLVKHRVLRTFNQMLGSLRTGLQ